MPPHPAIVLTPLRVEARAVAAGAPQLETVVCGMGPRRARRAASDLAAECRGAQAVAVAGFCGGLDPSMRPGDVVVATEVRGPNGSVALPAAPLLASAIARLGLRVHEGPLVSVDHVVRGEERARLATVEGAVAVDMETAWLIATASDRPHAVVRVVVDTAERELKSVATIPGGVRAYRSLRRVGRALQTWAAAITPRTVLMAEPQSFCAGVERAIEVVERAIELYGPPVYVRRQIVHNRHVVEELESRGAVFVDEVDEAPPGARLVFSAHGVAPAVEVAAAQRGQTVIDATCPLVAKVHREVRRFANRGYSIVLIGHGDHDETEGTMGEVPSIQLVSTPEDAAAVAVDDPERVAYVTQTTLAHDDVADVLGVLRHRFPDLVGPAADDICYATQNRQDAVSAMIDECDVLLVVGSQNSSNSNRLVEVAERAGCPAFLIDEAREIDLSVLAGTSTIGVTAGASAPSWIVDRVLVALEGLGPLDVHTRAVTTETVHFPLPEAVR
jgi:4-hydroxy-3-methylbut-2-enyl diphosphate reductase